MTSKQREIISRQVGVLEGLAWIQSKETLYVAECLDDVIRALVELLKEDAGEIDDGIPFG